jgi:DNA polymerase-3 subunit alpha
VATELWESLETFGQYGFNKSHAVCYVVISYACAFLKHFYPLEWWTAVLRNASKNEVDLKFWQHCGHLILLPDIS